MSATSNRADLHLCMWPDCGKSYSKRSKLIEHERSHTDTRPFECSQCEKTFRRNGHLQRHRQTAHNDGCRPFMCSWPGCEKSYTLKHHLKRHESAHTQPKPYSCLDCSESFAKKMFLKKHQQSVHNAEIEPQKSKKIYICETCDTETFSKWSDFQKHRKEHAACKDWICFECNKSFAHRRNLALHQARIHKQTDLGIELKKYQCPECSKSLSSANAVNVHVTSVHLGIKPYSCDYCPQNFAHKHLLARHKKKHQEASHPDATINVDSELKTENLLATAFFGSFLNAQKSFQCSTCSRVFKRFYDLARHREASGHEVEASE